MGEGAAIKRGIMVSGNSAFARKKAVADSMRVEEWRCYHVANPGGAGSPGEVRVRALNRDPICAGASNLISVLSISARCSGVASFLSISAR